VAVNCKVSPETTDAGAGATTIDTRVADTVVTVIVVELAMELKAAVMIVVPGTALVANPLLPGVLLTVATAVTEDDQNAVEVMS
jgi:hypothetical protein